MEVRLVALLVHPQVADELRNVLVGVAAVKDVFVADHRRVDRGVDEALRGGDVVGLPGAERGERRERIVDTAELPGDVAVPHAVELRLGQRRQPAVRPVGDLRGDVERLRVPGVRVRVDKARENLVQRVIRRPDPGIAAVRRELFEPHELRFGIRGKEARMPAAVRGRDHARVSAAGRRVARRGDHSPRRTDTTRRCRRRSSRRRIPSAI